MRAGWLATALLWIAGTAAAQTAPQWPTEIYDPAADQGAPADLILPLPCGGAMAFQRVAVPVDLSDPLADRRFRMGQSDPATGYSDYLRPAYLRGAFPDAEASASVYFIARYEITVGQARALRGACEDPFGPRDRFAQGALSWFQAIDLTRAMTEWLLTNAPDALPQAPGRTPFIRLPTETEWEFAVRGGAVADETTFAARRFFDAGELGDVAHFQAGGTGRGKLRPIGLRAPNPLGLYDVYGNAEEIMLEPYRLNAVGRRHGQVGGMVTRGGSIDATDLQIYTAARTEYPLFDPRGGEALAGAFFGLRPVIGAHIVSDADFDAIRDGWVAMAEEPSQTAEDPLAELSVLLDEEIDPRRRQSLESLQLEFRRARDAAIASLEDAARSTLLSGAAFVETLAKDHQTINRLVRDSAVLADRLGVTPPGPQREQLLASLRATVARLNDLRETQKTYVLAFRSALDTLGRDIPDASVTEAYQALASDLAIANQAALALALNRFWRDLSAYREEPDMAESALLDLALGD